MEGQYLAPTPFTCPPPYREIGANYTDHLVGPLIGIGQIAGDLFPLKSSPLLVKKRLQFFHPRLNGHLRKIHRLFIDPGRGTRL